MIDWWSLCKRWPSECGGNLLSVFALVLWLSWLLLLALHLPLVRGTSINVLVVLGSDLDDLVNLDSDCGCATWLGLFSIFYPLGSLIDGAYSFSVFGLPLLRLKFISELNLKSLCGSISLTSPQSWYSLCPIVTFSVYLKEKSWSIKEPPLDTLCEESPLPVKRKGMGWTQEGSTNIRTIIK